MPRRRPIYYDRDGKPLDLFEWTARFEHANRVVEATEVGGVKISTVWLGIDHNYSGEGPPLIFETMIFGGEHDGYQDRYSTESEARAGHAVAVSRVRSLLRVPHGTQEEPIVPNEDRPIADVEPGSVDITALDKAELLAALVNATSVGRFRSLAEPMTHERAAALIQERLGGVGIELGERGPFDFNYVVARPIKCDLTGPRISAFHVARYDRDAGAGTMARVVGELREAYERRRAERERTR